MARVVDAFAKRLQIQERLTAQIADIIEMVLQPQGVAVIVKATHGWMTTRGVHKHGVTLVTSRMLGRFRDSPSTRQEFMTSLNIYVPNQTSLGTVGCFARKTGVEDRPQRKLATRWESIRDASCGLQTGAQDHRSYALCAT